LQLEQEAKDQLRLQQEAMDQLRLQQEALDREYVAHALELGRKRDEDIKAAPQLQQQDEENDLEEEYEEEVQRRRKVLHQVYYYLSLLLDCLIIDISSDCFDCYKFLIGRSQKSYFLDEI
jgi:hypothetical protein